jgi:galactokinase
VRTLLPFEHKKLEEISSSTVSTNKAGIAENLARRAEARWGRRPRIFRAPGRVNLIGEHTDYNDGFVMPAAIRFSAWAAAAPRDDNAVTIHSENFSETRKFQLDRLPVQSQKNWSDYALGVLSALQRAGHGLRGADVLIDGQVPIGSGLSSSAAFETVVAFAMVSLASSRELDRTELALLCQQAERQFAGVQVGIMDQFVSAHAKAGNALLLDCRSLGYELLPLPAEASLVICNTMVHHELAGSAYNQRRAECEAGVTCLARRFEGVRALRDVTPHQLEQVRDELSPVVYRRCRHVVGENARVLEAAHALTGGRLQRFGQLMYESHRSLRDDYEVSCEELDVMVEITAALPGVYGARMTGGGFGGCTVNIVRNESVDAFRTEVAARYELATGRKPAIYITGAAEGAEEVRLGDPAAES